MNELPLRQIIQGDCLEILPTLESSNISLILTDLPYGVTQNPNDIPLPLEKIWSEWKRILKPSGNVVLTSQFPYTVELIESNPEWFKYDLIWDKELPTGFLNANRMPLRTHEHVLVFYERDGKYFPQKTIGERTHSRGAKRSVACRNYGKHREIAAKETHLKYPTSIISIKKLHASVTVHPTEKPVELAEYLIKTFSEEGDTVLDCCMGVGWTAEASIRHNRSFIGIEINKDYCEIARKRLEPWMNQTRLYGLENQID